MIWSKQYVAGVVDTLMQLPNKEHERVLRRLQPIKGLRLLLTAQIALHLAPQVGALLEAQLRALQAPSDALSGENSPSPTTDTPLPAEGPPAAS